MIVVGETRPTAHFGPGVWNNKAFGEVTKDDVGMATVKALGRRVAEVARLVAKVVRTDPCGTASNFNAADTAVAHEE